MKLYRYVLTYPQEYKDAGFKLEEYPVIKETPHGYWIGWVWWKKFVLKPPGRKRFAYLTKEDALQNYIKRTEKYQRILKFQLKRCDLGLILAKGTKI